MRVKGTRNIHASGKSMIVLKKKWHYFSWRLLESHFVDTKGVIVSVSIIVDKDITSKALYRYLSRWFCYTLEIFEINVISIFFQSNTNILLEFSSIMISLVSKVFCSD